jgi:ankyrin repeat protein
MSGRSLAAALLMSSILAGGGWADDLLDAAKRDDSAAALAALAAPGADPNAREVDGTTPLLWAVHHGDAALVRALIAAGADPSASNNYGALPMQEAAALGDAEIVGALLEGGADAESPNAEGQTALMAVARAGRVDTARLLLAAGADPNAVESWGGQTALMWAIAQRQLEMVDLLIDAGADVDARATARDWERHVTSEPRIKELHAAGFTPLLFAAREGCVECARRLVAAGAAVDLADPDGVTPLMLALMNRRFDTAVYLVEAGAEVNRWDWWGRTPLYHAVDMNRLPTSGRREFPTLDEATGLDVARMLIERGADPDVRLKLIPPERAMVADRVADDHVVNVGATALIRAAYGADVDMVRLLLDHGADATIRSGYRVGAVFAAAAVGGARGRAKTEDDIVACLELLVPAGAEINWADDTGRTALHMASRTNRGQVVRWLAAHGGDLYAEDDEGRLPMGYATGEADWIAFGTSDVVGVLPEMVAVLEELTAADGADARGSAPAEL